MAIEYPAQAQAENQVIPAQTSPRKGIFERFLNFAIPQDVIKQNNPALDGLRAMAALMVLLFHLVKEGASQSIKDPDIKGDFSTALWQASGYWNIGSKGVELFFVISAFLLFQGYSRALLNPNKSYPRTWQFLKRRFLRIYPAYLVSTILMVLLFTPQLLNLNNLDVLLSHIFLVYDFKISFTAAINPLVWTLAVETKFYVMVPFLALIMGWLLKKKKRKFKNLVVFIGIFLLIPFNFFIVTAYYLLYPDGEITTYLLNIIEYLPVFFAGIAASLIYVNLTSPEKVYLVKEKYKTVFNYFGLFSLLGLLIVPALAAGGFIDKVLYRVIEEQFAGICFSGILLATLLGGEIWGRFFSHPFLRFIGIISYSLYLWHQNLYDYVIIPIARSFKQEALVLPISFLLTFVIIIPVAYISYMFVERPFFRVRKSNVSGTAPTESKAIPAEQLNEAKS